MHATVQVKGVYRFVSECGHLRSSIFHPNPKILVTVRVRVMVREMKVVSDGKSRGLRIQRNTWKHTDEAATSWGEGARRH